MNKNPKLLVILAVVGVVLIFGMFWSRSKPAKTQLSTKPKLHKVFDVASGDTNNEVLKSIIAKQQKLEDQNKKLQLLNKRLLSKDSSDSKHDLIHTKDLLEEQINKISNELDEEKDNYKGHDSQYQVNGVSKLEGNDSIITSIPDLSSKVSKESNIVSSEDTSSTQPLPSDSETTISKDNPVYTIPDGSTVSNSILLSPLIGEVPVDGVLTEPSL